LFHFGEADFFGEALADAFCELFLTEALAELALEIFLADCLPTDAF